MWLKHGVQDWIEGIHHRRRDERKHLHFHTVDFLDVSCNELELSRLLAYKNCDDLMQLPRYPITDEWAHRIMEPTSRNLRISPCFPLRNPPTNVGRNPSPLMMRLRNGTHDL